MCNETRWKYDLEAYDVILLIETENSSDEELVKRFLNSQIYRESEKKTLALHVDDYEELAGLYYTYEFSDKIRRIGRTNQHGSMVNFVDNGLITEQEMFESILY